MNGPGARAGVWAGALHVLPLPLVSLENVKSTDCGGTACDCLGKTRLSPEGKKVQEDIPSKWGCQHRSEITNQLPLCVSAEDDSALDATQTLIKNNKMKPLRLPRKI